MLDEESEQTPIRSTKQPLQRNNNRKRQREKAREDEMLEQAMSVLASKKTKDVDADDLFGQSIGASLKSIPDQRSKEFLKVKIQELIFQAKFGILVTPQNTQAPFQMQLHHQFQQPLHSPNVVGTPSPASSSGTADNIFYPHFTQPLEK